MPRLAKDLGGQPGLGGQPRPGSGCRFISLG